MKYSLLPNELIWIRICSFYMYMKYSVSSTYILAEAKINLNR